MDDRKSDEKSKFEIDKLKAEIGHLKYRWMVPSIIQAVPALLLVIVTVYIAMTSGVIDARKEYLASDNKLLEVQKIELQNERKAIQSDIENLQRSLEKSQEVVRAYETERDALQTIRRHESDVKIEFLDNPIGFGIELDGMVEHLEIEPPFYREVGIALDAAAKVQSLRKLTLRNIKLSSADLSKISNLLQLEQLRVYPKRFSSAGHAATRYLNGGWC
jgi:hypothetical protein